jgi:AcrR family transcriptional regulator
VSGPAGGSAGSGLAGGAEVMFTTSTLTRQVHVVNMRGMAQGRDAYHHGDLRNALVSSAARLIERQGSEAFSLREAAREVGVSANAAYRHFDDKAALMTAVAAEGFARLSAQMQRSVDEAARGPAAESPEVARFQAVGRAYVCFAAEHPELFRLMFGQCGAQCLRVVGERTGPTPWDHLGSALDALVASGALSPERRVGAELKAWTVVHGFASLALDGHVPLAPGPERDAALESVLDFAVQGLCGAPASPARRPL